MCRQRHAIVRDDVDPRHAAARGEQDGELQECCGRRQPDLHHHDDQRRHRGRHRRRGPGAAAVGADADGGQHERVGHLRPRHLALDRALGVSGGHCDVDAGRYRGHGRHRDTDQPDQRRRAPGSGPTVITDPCTDSPGQACASTSITTAAAVVPANGTLAATGLDVSGLISVAALFVVLGMLALVLSRRHARTATAELPAARATETLTEGESSALPTPGSAWIPPSATGPPPESTPALLECAPTVPVPLRPRRLGQPGGLGCRYISRTTRSTTPRRYRTGDA